MKIETFPVALQTALLREVRQTAQEAGLSVEDAIQQSLRLGLPKLREQLAISSLQPFTPQEAKEAFAPEPEWDAITSAMSRLPIARIEE